MQEKKFEIVMPEICKNCEYRSLYVDSRSVTEDTIRCANNIWCNISDNISEIYNYKEHKKQC